MLIDRMNIYTIQRTHHLLCYCAGTNGFFIFSSMRGALRALLSNL